MLYSIENLCLSDKMEHSNLRVEETVTCKHWRSEDSFCLQEEETVNEDELDDCAEGCPYYEPSRKYTTVICSSCGTEFPLRKANKVEINNKEHPKCPTCGTVVGLERDNEQLSKGGNLQDRASIGL
jgi:DNA-directed RNA polymerase subunit RPC12/RpoP